MPTRRGVAPVTFIDRDRVEKAGRELPVRLQVCHRPGDYPVKSGTDLESRVDAALPVDGPRHVDPAASVRVAVPCPQVIAHFPTQFGQRRRDLLVDAYRLWNVLAARQVATDVRGTAIQVSDERQAPVAKPRVPYLDI